jgi:hypothetical protein
MFNPETLPEEIKDYIGDISTVDEIYHYPTVGYYLLNDKGVIVVIVDSRSMMFLHYPTRNRWEFMASSDRIKEDKQRVWVRRKSDQIQSANRSCTHNLSS